MKNLVLLLIISALAAPDGLHIDKFANPKDERV